MELKIKNEYTNLIYPYIINKKTYNKYLLKLLKENNCEIKLFEKEKQEDLYNYFLPNIRNHIFTNFSYNKNEINKFENIDKELQSTILSKYSSIIFKYNIKEKEEIFSKIETVEIICFNTGICFLLLKTNIKNNELDNIKELNKIINKIIPKNNNLEKLDIDSKKPYIYSYICLDKEEFNENTQENEIKEKINLLSNIESYNSNKKINLKNIFDINNLEYTKIAITKTASILITSEIDEYNINKLPKIYNNEYLYTYIFELYKYIYLKKLSNKYKESKYYDETRKEFIEYTKTLWSQDITDIYEGKSLIENWSVILGTEKLYNNLKNKYNLLYKEANIEKEQKVNKIILIILIISLIINIINFIYLI